MKTIKAIDLSEHIGWYMAFYFFNSKHFSSDIKYGKIIEINKDKHKIILEIITGNKETREGFYRDENEVELYDECDLVLLLMKDHQECTGN